MTKARNERTVQEWAAEFSGKFEGAVRENGEGYRRVKAGEESEALADLIREAHNGMLPDDWKYRFIEEALDAIAAEEDEEETHLEPSSYTSELTEWLASHLDRVGYADQARGEWGNAWESISDLLALGMEEEQNEVLASVRASLERLQADAEEEFAADNGQA